MTTLSYAEEQLQYLEWQKNDLLNVQQCADTAADKFMRESGMIGMYDAKWRKLMRLSLTQFYMLSRSDGACAVAKRRQLDIDEAKAAIKEDTNE